MKIYTGLSTRNPHWTSDVLTKEVLLKYLEETKKGKKYYIRFSNSITDKSGTFYKFGINPGIVSSETPRGIYAYNLENYRDFIENNNTIANMFPYLSSAEGAHIFEYTGNKLISMFDYENSEYLKHLGILRRMGVIRSAKEGTFDLIKKYAYRYADLSSMMKDMEVFPAEKLYVVTYIIAILIASSPDTLDLTKENILYDPITKKINTLPNIINSVGSRVTPGRVVSAWNKVLRFLSIDGLEDNSAVGLIHPNELCQTLFLSGAKNISNIKHYTCYLDKERINEKKELKDKLSEDSSDESVYKHLISLGDGLADILTSSYSKLYNKYKDNHDSKVLAMVALTNPSVFSQLDKKVTDNALKLLVCENIPFYGQNNLEHFFNLVNVSQIESLPIDKMISFISLNKVYNKKGALKEWIIRHKLDIVTKSIYSAPDIFKGIFDENTITDIICKSINTNTGSIANILSYIIDINNKLKIIEAYSKKSLSAKGDWWSIIDLFERVVDYRPYLSKVKALEPLK